jgi:hypothetical protein
MSAYEDFIEAQRSIVSVLNKIEAKSVLRPRSPEQLVLNGLRISAFVAFEDFLRRRTLEVFQWLGTSGVLFKNLPQSLQALVLQGTVEGLHFSISRTEKSERITLLQLQGLLLSGTGENQSFVPSEFFFGRGASNIGGDDIHRLLVAMGFISKDKFDYLDSIFELVGMKHLGTANSVFSTLASSRHRSAHSFPTEFNLEGYKTVVTTSLPFLAFSIDTCLSQSVQHIAKVVKSGEIYTSYDVKKTNIRVFEFEQNTSSWIEFRGGKQVKSLAKGGLEKRFIEFSKGAIGKGDSAIVKESKGGIGRWHQPIPGPAI